jgi:hypothetical protein
LEEKRAEVLARARAILRRAFRDAIPMSALNPKDIEALHERLVKFFLDNMTQVDLVVSYGKEGCTPVSAKTFTY